MGAKRRKSAICWRQRPRREGHWAPLGVVALSFRVSCHAIGALRRTPAGNPQEPAGTGTVIGSVIRPACACEIATVGESPYPSWSRGVDLRVLVWNVGR
ncbi:uncharacterized protein B0H64DRAFT_25019 [Chaetomium fimeti]|uniref:Uncharacterized protein n=1 Tax=Chaetomium fimeti TaxID=1854472 RepID=A0AAE0LX58_9PEZI|nr:hypothetical protein B0H64DRAFT_25019 [Chaetomium fimeti]